MRSTAFFINGGAGRMLCSIPALELFEKENPDNDFIIITEGGMDMYKNHPSLHKRCFEPGHKDLFSEKIKDRDCVSLEPYRIWEYYNQECSLAQAFDIQINNKGIRDLPKPALHLNSDEEVRGFMSVKEIKEKTKKDKVVVFQPFGRSSNYVDGFVNDTSGRSFDTMDSASIIKKLQAKNYAVMLMSEFAVPYSDLGCKDAVSHPQNISLRDWAGIIKNVDHFIGCDSVGQHIAHSVGTSTTVVLGSTYPINTSYPKADNVHIIDIDEDKRVYAPIRIAFDEYCDRSNDRCMKIKNDYKIIDSIVKSVDKACGVKNK